MRASFLLLFLVLTGPAAAVTLEFPSSGSELVGAGSCSGFQVGVQGLCFQMGDAIEETFTGTGIESISRSTFSFSMDDDTQANFEPRFDVLLNDTVVGSYTLLEEMMGLVDLAFEHEPITGPSYTIRIVQVSAAVGGAGSYNWNPGGTATLLPEPTALSLLGIGIVLLGVRRAGVAG